MVFDDVVDAFPYGGEEPLPPLHFGFETDQRTVCELFIEVTDGADGVRQPFTGFERRAALEVDQNEVEARRVVMGRQTGDEGSQEFTLTRTRGTADETVRTVFDEVEGVHALVANADFGAVSGGFLPGVDNLLGGGRRADAGEFGQAHQPGQTRTGDDELGIVEFCEHPRQFCDVVKVDAADNNVVDGTAFFGFVEGCGGVFVHCNNYGTGGGKLLFGRGNHDTKHFMHYFIAAGLAVRVFTPTIP